MAPQEHGNFASWPLSDPVLKTNTFLKEQRRVLTLVKVLNSAQHKSVVERSLFTHLAQPCEKETYSREWAHKLPVHANISIFLGALAKVCQSIRTKQDSPVAVKP